MENFNERIRRRIEEYTKKCDENPRYNIERLADKDGNVRVYFHHVDLMLYNRGRKSRGSTERFEPEDVIVRVPVDRIERITEGNVIVDTRAWRVEED